MKIMIIFRHTEKLGFNCKKIFHGGMNYKITNEWKSLW